MPAESAETRTTPGHDEKSFDFFYEVHWSRVVGVTASLCRDFPVAEELAQEAFLRAYRRWSRVSTLDRPDLWVRRAALNLAISRFRRTQAEARALARWGRRRVAPAEPTLPPDLEHLWDALTALPTRQAHAAALYYVDDLPIAEVARVMNCSEGTVKAHLHGARERLRAAVLERGKVS